jgi:hypothetical protein
MLYRHCIFFGFIHWPKMIACFSETWQFENLIHLLISLYRVPIFKPSFKTEHKTKQTWTFLPLRDDVDNARRTLNHVHLASNKSPDIVANM